MLRAYDYAERRKDKKAINKDSLFRKEKQIAYHFVMEHPAECTVANCPVCGSEKTKYIFERWDVNYRYCNECKSIFVPVKSDIIDAYLQYEPMKKLKQSEEYQREAKLRRAENWTDVIMWAEYRIFRYLGKNSGLEVIDWGNKYQGFVEQIQNSKFAGGYMLKDSILPMQTKNISCADILLYMNQLQHEPDPIGSLKHVRNMLKKDGLLILSTRLGSGFDILTLKGGTENIFPYEHIMLPSKKGLEVILDRAGFELMEITTPGTRDMEIVLKNRERIEESNFFIKYFLDIANEISIQDFQQFLQKSGLSSFAQVIARKRSDIE